MGVIKGKIDRFSMTIIRLCHVGETVEIKILYLYKLFSELCVGAIDIQ